MYFSYLLYDSNHMKPDDVLKKVSDVCRRKHFSYSTEKSYLVWVRSYIKVLATFPQEWTSEKKAGEFFDP